MAGHILSFYLFYLAASCLVNGWETEKIPQREKFISFMMMKAQNRETRNPGIRRPGPCPLFLFRACLSKGSLAKGATVFLRARQHPGSVRCASRFFSAFPKEKYRHWDVFTFFQTCPHNTAPLCRRFILHKGASCLSSGFTKSAQNKQGGFPALYK